MKKVLVFTFLAALVFVLTYCTKDIVATDITKKTVNILAPGNGVHTPNNAITFWWDEVKGADKYQIQIVTPSFANVVSLVIDSNVTTTKLTLTLDPGSYEWRVKAINNSGSTVYSTRSFVIDTTSNLANITIALLSPIDSAYTNNTVQTFSWSSVSAATSYDFSILDNTGATLVSTTTTSTSLTHTFTQTAGTNVKYTWKVRATNAFSNSGYTSRPIFIYLATPTAPTAIHPLGTGTVIPTLSVGDSLSWTSQVVGDYDSLFVVTDSVNPTIYSKLKTKMTKSSYKITAADTTGTASWFVKNTQYYWRLNRNDKAGNSSAYSSFKTFKAN